MIISVKLLPVYAAFAVCVGFPFKDANAQINVDELGYEFVNITAGSGFIASLQANNSYCCTVLATQTNTTAGLSTSVQSEGNPGTVIAGTARGGMEPAVVLPSSFADT